MSKASPATTTIALAAALVAEVLLVAGVAWAARDLPAEAVVVGRDGVVIETVDQRAYGAFAVPRIVSPVDGWAVVRADWGDGVPAEVIGAAPVVRGENRDVAVVTDPARGLPPAAFVLLVADRGARGEFEYASGSDKDTTSLDRRGGGMMGGPVEQAPAIVESVDWPLVHDGKPVMAHFAIEPFDIVYRLPDANIASTFLNASQTAAEVYGIDAPEASWVVIIRVGQGGDDGNEVLGAGQVGPGRTEHLVVPITAAKEGAEVSALLVADLGSPGVLEVDPSAPDRSVDAPYLVRSWFVWKRVAPAH